MNERFATDFRNSFEAFIDDRGFPCLGAKSAHAQGTIEFFAAHDTEAGTDDAAIAARLQDFSGRQTPDSLFTSFVVGFPTSRVMDELNFERSLWARLQAIHEYDRLRFEWDENVSNDPASPRFSMSVGGKGFYIVGLHPQSSRLARRFACPASACTT